jgi:hypothetical protein
VIGPCVSAGLRGGFTLIPGSQGAGNVVGRIVLTNVGPAPCRTGGYVGMQLLAANGQPLPTTVEREVASVQPVLVVVPGASASATARWSPDVAGPGDSTSGQCQPTATATDITPPNDRTHLVVPGPGTSVCERGILVVSPLQAGANAGD